MELRQLGNSKIKVTPLAFGAWAIGGWMWGGAEEKDALKAIRASFDAGITSIDTAPVYGFGRSEELVAKAMVGIPRDRYQILTKFGMNWETEEGTYFFDTTDNNNKPIRMHKWGAKRKVKKELEDTLRRMKTDYIDLYQQHWPDQSTPISETMEALDELMKEGKILAAGVCNYSADQVEEALKTVALASNQVPYSMVKRDIEAKEVPQAIAKKFGIIAYSPLQRGILTGKMKPDHQFNEGDTRAASVFYQSENIRRINAMLERLKPIADGHHATIGQVVINWTVQRPAIACVLVGARDESQVKDNAKALSFKLSAEEIAAIDKEVTSLQLAS